MRRLADTLARWIARCPAFVALAGVVIAATAAGVIASRNAFDSDILTLLPSGHPAVKGLRIYNTQFTQTRELAFLLTWKKPPADAEETRQKFISLLLKQPWVQRILDKPPMEGESSSVQDILVPLLLNLPSDQFAAALQGLSPEKIRTRMASLAQRAEAGSPKARFELEADPLGLAAQAARPVAETVSISDTFTLISPDGIAAIVPIITNQPDNSTEACHTTMREVRRFLKEASTTLGPEAPAISVTGRSAYVDEISSSMGRDIALTSFVSLLCVTTLFWVGFRQLLPLIGIALLLALTALVAMACGMVLFHQLNIVAISFCSILFGLGDDFSLLLCQRFFQSRAGGNNREEAIAESIAHCLPGILWVALTTGVGFLALCLSGSPGFAQLGALVAIGVMLCAIFMPVFLFLFVHKSPPEAAKTGAMGAFVERCMHAPGRILQPAGVLFVLAAVIALLPWHRLGFDLSPASLEPHNIPAARTLAAMMEKFPATFEPVMVVLEHPTREQLQALDGAIIKLKDEKLIESSSSPSALVLDAKQAAANAALLKSWQPEPAIQALDQSATENGLNPAIFQKARATLEHLRKESETRPQWQNYLQPTSTWWFLLDRMVAPETGAAIAYIKLPQETTLARREKMAEVITAAVPEASVTGWSQALASLVSWAQRELAIFGGSVALIILLILAVIYRDARLLGLHFLALLGAIAGTVATLKILGTPINLLNVLAFPLMLAVGVDYGTHIILATREDGNAAQNLAGVVKPIALSGLTTATGFGALMLAQNPSLSGLGIICAIGVTWCLLASLLIVAPGALFLLQRKSGSPSRPKF